VPAQIINDDMRKKRPERSTAPTEHSYNETGLLYRHEELLPKLNRQQAEQPHLVSREKG